MILLCGTAVAQFGNKLLFCCHNFRIFIMQQRNFCYSATPVAECFSPEKYSAILLLQWQNVSLLTAILLLYTLTEAVPPGAIAIR